MKFEHDMLKYNSRLEAAAANAPVMKVGERGQAVRMVQQALIALCFPQPKAVKKYGTPDGVFTSETVKAVKAFQKEQGLTRNGRVNDETLFWLDACLVANEVPFVPLPPIPDMEFDIDAMLEASTRVVVDTLLNCPLTGTNYLLKMHLFSQAVTQETYIHGRSFKRIGEAVRDGEITVTFDTDTSKARPAAWYDFKNDVIVLGRPLENRENDRCLVVHEAAHAICDRLGNPLDAMFSEAIGFVSESLYMLRTAGRPKQVGHYVADKVYKKSYAAAEQIAAGKTPPEGDIQEIGKLVKEVPEYAQYAYGTVQYNGRSRW